MASEQMKSLLLALVLALAVVTAASAADDPLLTEATDLPGTVMFLDSGAPGMVLAASGDCPLTPRLPHAAKDLF